MNSDRPIRRPARLHAKLYIYRKQSEKLWWCAIPYRDDTGERRQRRRRFRDRAHGSKARALKAASQWRDHQLQRPEVRIAMGDHRPLTLYSEANRNRAAGNANPFGLVGVTATFRKKPLGGNFSVTANRGRKRWFSMLRYGPYGAFRRAVAQRCQWLGIDLPGETELRERFQGWQQHNSKQLEQHGLPLW